MRKEENLINRLQIGEKKRCSILWKIKCKGKHQYLLKETKKWGLYINSSKEKKEPNLEIFSLIQSLK